MAKGKCCSEKRVTYEDLRARLVYDLQEVFLKSESHSLKAFWSLSELAL